MPKKEEFFDEKKDVFSEFNEAKFQIIRLHDSYMRIRQARRSGNFSAYKWELDCLWDELSSKAIMKSEKYLDDIQALDQKIAQSTKKEALYDALRRKERYLRLIQEDVGMGGKLKDMDEEGIDF